MTEFEEIYNAYFKDVELYLLAICHDAHLAEELTAEVFFRALEALPQYRGDSDIRTWLCSISRNCYLSYLRKKRPGISIDELEIPDPRQGIEERFIDKDQALKAHKILHDLSEPYKEVFSLRVFGQLSFADIGHLFGKTPNWACVTYHRAKSKIQKAMEVQNR